jgi:hypothetical protein
VSPSRLLRRQRSPSPLALVASGASPDIAAPVAVPAGSGRPTLPGDGKFPAEPPFFPRRGTSSVPLPVLLGWRAEVLAASQAHDVASQAAQAANAALGAADRRRDFAWTTYYTFLGLAYDDEHAEAGTSSQAKGKGKGKGKAKGKAKGKGKARAPPSDVGDDDGESEAGDEDDGGAAMDES